MCKADASCHRETSRCSGVSETQKLIDIPASGMALAEVMGKTGIVRG
jgi:hypothetical protein